MKKILTLICFLAVAAATFVSCNDYETYAEKREKENAAISQFISYNSAVAKELFDKPITVISETDFNNHGCTTDVTKNEFVLFESTGVYMQIVRKGCGSPIQMGETATVLCRFREYNLLTDSLQLSNESAATHANVDVMNVTNTSGTFYGSFQSGILASAYSSNSVPAGWLTPLRYINVGRQSEPDDEIAKVNLIVPSAQGQSNASQSTYPCFYTLTYQKGI